MAVNLPLLNQAVWAPVLNAALAEVDARLADLEVAGRPVWHAVTAAPAASLGATGDFALNVSTGTGRGDVYQKTDDVTWVLVGNIAGPAGAPGAPGLPGVNAVPADTAVGTYIATEGSETQAALTAALVALPDATISDYAVASRKTGATGGLTWVTKEEHVARALGWAVITDARWAGGAKGGTNDDTAAIQAAISSLTRGGTVFIPAGTWNHKDLVWANSIEIKGAGKNSTVLNYTGTGTAFNQSAPGTSTRRYGVSVERLSLQTSTGVKAFDLDSTSTSTFSNLDINGFSDCGFHLHSDTNGYCVYNRFYDVLVRNCGTAYRVRNGSNATTWVASRANACTTYGFDIQDTNDCTLDGCQVEACATGVFLDAAVTGTATNNRIKSVRFENCTTGILINSANVSHTYIDGVWSDSSTPTLITDNGTSTHRASSLFSVNSAGTIISTATGVTLTAAGLALSSASGVFQAATSTPLYLRGNTTDTAGNVATWVGNGTTLSAPGRRIIGFCRDTPVTHALPVAYIDSDGSYEYANGIKDLAGSGSPEGVVTAVVGSTYRRADGGAGTCFYVKESGTGNTGWVAK